MGEDVVDIAWVDRNIAYFDAVPDGHPSPQVDEMRRLLAGWAEGFCEVRADVHTSDLAASSRGLLHDEANSLLRAIDDGFVVVEASGHFSVAGARAKATGGHYSLLSKSGTGAALNLEYVIQVGATAELAHSHGWPGEDLDFERGEFDAFGYGPDGRVLLAMEAKCRARGSDSVEKLLREWLRLSDAQMPGAATNAGRKYGELLRLCEGGTVIVWLVAANLRWAFRASSDGRRISLRALPKLPSYSSLTTGPEESGRAVLWVAPHDPARHRRGTRGASGNCTWFCSETAEWSMAVREHGGSESTFALCDSHRRRVEAVYG